MTSFFDHEELTSLGLKSFGKNVLISRKASIYQPSEIAISNNVRIDDFCILSGKIDIGSYVHISAFAAIYAANGVILDDFSGLSPRATVYSAIDDFSGEFLINPMVDSDYTNVTGGVVKIGKYVQIGASSIIFPNITIADGSIVGALSLVKESLSSWGVYAGVPAKLIKRRSDKLLKHVAELNKLGNQ